MAAAYPTLPELVQHAKNASGNIARRESEVQLLLRIQEAVDMSKGSPVDWTALKTKLLMRHVSNPEGLPTLIKFVRRWGGGVGGRFVRDLRTFHQQFVSSERVIPTSTFAALADLKVDAASHAPFFAMAVVKAQGSCPVSKVQNQICRFISNSDITSLAGHRKEEMKSVDRMLSRCYELVSSIGSP